MSYTLIERRQLTEAASSLLFSGIPQFYTDLVIFISARNTEGTNVTTLTFNSGGSYTNRWINGTGSSTNSGTARFDYVANPSTFTANTYANSQVYIPNYTSSTAKLYSSEGVSENNATAANQLLITGLWSGTEAINSITFTAGSGGNFVAGSSISLYGINRQQAFGAPKAIGGNITFSNGYWVHTFTGSGTFSTLEDLNIDALVVSGGGAGGSQSGGGGGAGGFLVLNNSRLTKGGQHTVAIGAGGAVFSATSLNENGSSTTFLNTSPLGGGRGGNLNSPSGSLSGGSGGGAGMPQSSTTIAGSAGTAGQGFAGGSGVRLDNPIRGGGGGGGGAGGVGLNGNPSTATGGNGGPGLSWNGIFYAGGGGGQGDPNGSLGGIGGGGNGGAGQFGSAGSPGVNNFGGGGGGGTFSASGGAGGSGVVVVRYKA